MDLFPLSRKNKTVYMKLDDVNDMTGAVSKFHLQLMMEFDKPVWDKYRVAIAPEVDALGVALAAIENRVKAVFNSVATGND